MRSFDILEKKKLVSLSSLEEANTQELEEELELIEELEELTTDRLIQDLEVPEDLAWPEADTQDLTDMEKQVEYQESVNQLEKFLQEIDAKIKAGVKDAIKIPEVVLEDKTVKEYEEKRLRDVLSRNKEYLSVLFSKYRSEKQAYKEFETQKEKIRKDYEKAKLDIQKYKQEFYETQTKLKEYEQTFLDIRLEISEEKEELEIPILQISPEVEKKQRQRVAALKQSRNQQVVKECLHEIEIAATDGKNLMPVFVKASDNYVTLGEMVGTLKKHFGIYEESVVF